MRPIFFVGKHSYPNPNIIGNMKKIVKFSCGGDGLYLGLGPSIPIQKWKTNQAHTWLQFSYLDKIPTGALLSLGGAGAVRRRLMKPLSD